MFFPDLCFNPITSDFGRLKIYGDGPRWGPVWGDFETGFWASDFRWHGFHWNYGNPKIHTKIHTISASWSMFPIEMAICGQYFQTNPHVHRFPQPQARTCEKPDPELRHDQVMDKELPMRESWNLKRSHWMAVWYMKWYRYVYIHIYIYQDNTTNRGLTISGVKGHLRFVRWSWWSWGGLMNVLIRLLIVLPIRERQIAMGRPLSAFRKGWFWSLMKYNKT